MFQVSEEAKMFKKKIHITTINNLKYVCKMEPLGKNSENIKNHIFII
jgi:hypothetical protein